MKGIKNFFYIVFFMVGSFFLSWAVPLMPKKILDFPISTRGMTRITVENDLIDDIFVYPNTAGENLQRHSSGHIFIVGEGISKPIYLTLITKRGLAQDLKLLPQDKHPEPILLSYEDFESKAKQEEEAFYTILKSFLKEGISFGFYMVNPVEANRTQGALSAVAERSYSNGRYLVTEFIVKNESSKRVVLEPRLLFRAQDIASVFNAEGLDPEGQAKLYVLQKI